MAAWFNQLAADLRTLNVGDWVIIALGFVALVIGLIVLAQSRRPIRLMESPEDAQPLARMHWADRLIIRHALTTPTILAAGVTCLIFGYHLIAWGLPVHWSPMKVAGAWWWTVPLAGGILIAASRAIDRLDSPSNSQ